MTSCPICSFENAEANTRCQQCGSALGNPYLSPPEIAVPATATAGNDAVATVIPYRNANALIAYYLGLFSCFPALGFPLAIVALVLAIRGLQAVLRNPNVHGTAHALIGLICGSIGFLINLLIIFAIVMAMVVG